MDIASTHLAPPQRWKSFVQTLTPTWNSERVAMSLKDKHAKKSMYSVDTLAFTESLGLQTFRKEQRKTWMKEDDDQLLNRLAEMYPAEYEDSTLKASSVNWEMVSQAFGGERKAKDCRKRWALSLDPNLRRGKWTPDEDALLVEQFKIHGALWQQVALAIEGRTEHQCLKRYYEVLDPNVCNRLKNWTEEEDLLLIDLVTRHGTKWKTVANEFEGRPSLTCRNRWRNVVTAVVRGRASASVVTKMMGNFDGNIESLAKGTLPPARTSEVKAELHNDDAQGLSRAEDIAENIPEPSGHGLSSYSTLNVSQQKPLPSLNALVMSPLPRKAPWQESFLQTGVSDQSLQLPAHSIVTSREPQIPRHMAQSRQGLQDLKGHENTLGHQKTQGHQNSRDHQSIHGPQNTQPAQDVQVPPAVQPAPGTASEWKYTLAGAPNVAENDPIRTLLAFGGNINLEQLANYLVQCANQYNLQVNIHHHHHYPQIVRPVPNAADPASQPLDLPGFAHLHLEVTGQLPFFGALPADFAPSPAAGRMYSVEPEAQLLRFQHFNYLPPLTPVPKLQSSASSPDASSRGSTHHHHHHHHHHGQFDSLREGPIETETSQSREISVERETGSKESDLFRLLNVAELKIDAHGGPGRLASGRVDELTEGSADRPANGPGSESRSHSMTPLTQAVQMAAASDAAQTAFYKRSAEELASSSTKRQHVMPERDQGLEFFSQTPQDENEDAQYVPLQHRAADGQSQQMPQNQQMPQSQHMHEIQNMPPPLSAPQPLVTQPVSQHHPLHYFTSTTSAPPEDLLDEEDEEFFNSWGMYAMRDKPQEPLEVSEESSVWFPFNPS